MADAPAAVGGAGTAAAPAAADFRQDVTDADIARQQDEIKRAVEESQPLVGDVESPDVLLDEYKDNAALLPKIADFARKYSGIRRSRGDGNCFYRSFLVCVGEHFVKAGVTPVPADAAAAAAMAADASQTATQRKYASLVVYIRESLEKLIALGYPDITTPDFQEAMLAYMESLAGPGATVEGVLEQFKDKMGSFYVITYLRCLCSLEILTHEDDYLPYIMGLAPHCISAKDFCDREVEPVATDADQIQIIALSKAWRVTIAIAYVDASAGTTASVLKFPEGADDAAFPRIVDLLYRPGHYDVAYPK